MAMVQIDENQLKALTTGYQLLDRLMANPKTKAQAEKLVKSIHPDVVTSEDLAEPVVGPIKAELAELKKWKQEREDSELAGNYTSRFEELKKQGFTEDGIEKLKKLMVDRSVPDVDAAVALFEKQNPKPAEKPAGLRSNHWTIGQKDDKAEVDKLMQDPDSWANEKAFEVLDELKSGKPAFGAAVGMG